MAESAAQQLPFVLSPIEARVLACLMEKEMVTPEYYPLSLNALKAACNQKSNRDPLMQLDEPALKQALEKLRYEYHLVWHVQEAGSRVPKYRHNIPGVFEFSRIDRAVMCELMLRGPQRMGELRSRVRRLCELDSSDQIELTLKELMDWDGRKLVARLPPAPGGREPRYTHLLCGEQDVPQANAPAVQHAVATADAPGTDRLAALEQEVAALRNAVRELQEQLNELRGPASHEA